jgi:hypothetical protein
MFSRLGPITISCDAPPYTVIRACETLAFQSPSDVRWCRMSHHSEPRGVLGLNPWKWFSSKGRSHERTCTCGRPLPVLDKYAFTFVSERVVDYLLGQCPWCRTIYWEEG